MGWFFTLLIAGNGPHCEEISIILSTNPSGIKPSSPRVWLNQCPTPVSPRKAQVLSGCCVLSTRGFKTRHHGECNEGIWSYGVIYIEDISRRLSNSTEVPNHYMYIHINVYIYDMIYIYICKLCIYTWSCVRCQHWTLDCTYPEVQSRQSLDVGLTDHHLFKVVCNRENHSGHFEHGYIFRV